MFQKSETSVSVSDWSIQHDKIVTIIVVIIITTITVIIIILLS